MKKDKFKKIVSECKSKSQICVNLGYKVNGSGLRKVNLLIEEYNIDVSHFDVYWYHKEKAYPIIEKECPICGNVFETKLGHKKEKTTCSRGCSNTYFRTGENHGNWKEDVYRSTCFEFHEKKCVVCGEDKIVAVHHYDSNHNNNKKENLVPMCPTHHGYWHSKYRGLIKKIVDEYVINFKNNMVVEALK